MEEAVKIVNKIGFLTFGKSFGEIEVPELLVAADAADITTNGKLDSAKAQGVIAEDGVDLEIEETLGNAPHWMKLVWQKVTKRQKLASMKQKKKKESAWESAIPIEN